MANSTRTETPFDRDQASAYLDVQYADRPVRVVLAHQVPGGGFSDTDTFDLPADPAARRVATTALLNRAEFLTERRGADVWITPTTLAKGRRTQENMGLGHTAWVDLDAKDAHSSDHLAFAIEEIRNEGGFIVHSSTDGVHAYFLLSAPLAPDDLRQVNRGYQKRFKDAGADPAAVDASRLLRLPGTWNRKYDPPQAVTAELTGGWVAQDTASLLRAAPVAAEPVPDALVYTDEMTDDLEILLLDHDYSAGQISEAFHQRVKECKEAGLSQAKAVTLLTGWLRQVDAQHRYHARMADEVARSWDKPDTRESADQPEPLGDEEDPEAKRFELEVRKEERRLRAQTEARKRIDAMKAATHPPVASLALDWDSLMDQPLPEFLVEDVLIEGGVALWAGESGLGKSFAVLDLLLSVATGVPFQERPTKQCSTLYVVGEGAYDTRLRAMAWAREHNLERVDGFAVYPKPVNLNNEAEVDRMVAYAIDQGFGLVCLDTLSQSTAGGNENDNGEMAAAMHAAHRIAATTLLVHHTGKSLDAGMRGASVLHNNADTVIHQRRIKKTVEGKDTQLPQHLFELYLAKSKASADHYVLGTYERATVELGIDPRKPANVLTTCVIRPYVVVTGVTVGAGGVAEGIAHQMHGLGFTCQNTGKAAIKKRWNEMLLKNDMPECTASDVTIEKAYRKSLELWLDGTE